MMNVRATSLTCLAFVSCAVLAAVPAESATITISFTGQLAAGNNLFATGDTFSGAYTFDPTSTILAHPDSTLDIQSVAVTDWSVSVSSSVISPFVLGGSQGVIALGNDTSFGDRYVVTLSGATYPGGNGTGFVQLDIQDPIAQGQDILSGLALTNFPDLSLAAVAQGRFVLQSAPTGCVQCFFALASLESSAVPEPGTLLTLAAGLGLGLRTVRRKGRTRARTGKASDE